MGNKTQCLIFNQKSTVMLGEHNIGYFLKSSRKDIQHLVVLFNCYRHHGWDFENSINFLKCNVLIIEDKFQSKQSCYLGKENFIFADLINQLILIALNQLCLTKDNCTLIGASKGGSASLYFGLKYDYKNIISLAFVGDLGTWMINQDYEMAMHIMGNENENTVNKYNNLLPNLIRDDKNKNRNIYAFISSNDNFYLKYNQKEIIHKLNDKYQNFNLFFTQSELVLQHDQVTPYFLPEMLSITYLLSQGISPVLPDIQLNNKIFKGTILPNQQTIESLNIYKKQTKVVSKPINSISKLTLIDNKLFLEGNAYIIGVDSPTSYDIFKYLKICNIHTKEHQEILIGSVPKTFLSRELYEQTYFNYTAAGTATMNFAGINLGEINTGIYEIQISITDNKNLRDYGDLKLNISSLDIRSIDNLFEYRLFQKQDKIYLVKRALIGRDVINYAYLSIEKEWVKGTLFHLEGIFIIPGVDMTEFYQGGYYLIAKNELNQYAFVLGQVRNNNLGANIGNILGGYDACYYATMKFSGIDTKNFKVGNYDLYLSLGYKSELFTVKINKKLHIEINNCKLI